MFMPAAVCKARANQRFAARRRAVLNPARRGTAKAPNLGRGNSRAQDLVTDFKHCRACEIVSVR